MARASPVPGRGAALAVLTAGAAVIGLAPILVRLAEAGPAAAGVWRLVFAMPILWLLARREPATDGARGPALLAGLMFALDLSCWHYGIALTSVSNATVLANLTPVVVVTVAWIFLKQRPRAMFLAAVALAVAGAAMMALGKLAGTMRSSWAGDSLSAVSAVWYALYLLAVGRARQGQGAMRVMLWSSLVAMPLMLLVALAFGERLLPAALGGWLACAGLGVMHVAGQGAITWALGRLPASVTSVVILIQPVVATLLGWLLFRETLGPLQALGAAAALGGIVLAQFAAQPQAADRP